ncbi:cholinephosphate cytidylyltransferase/choline kinase [Schaalia cardiffensis F0333]|uniref:Cholinephosphate cytidylyltransferase/choline kinase n=2 Tax=Schaalia TaxID=2529408 RepID=N6WFG3_9ACTO|nr:cholinephosphate cytidylyltransferase/choline kinase [Schaalia cardiffensis F0333]
MMSASLTQTQFDVLRALMNADAPLTQRELKDITGSSLGRVNTAVRECEALGYIADRTITQAGLDALAPYKVDNAVILAAGMSSRFAPISYERPKGTLRVRGEILIERQIRQLQEVGITDITVVVGYKKEYFFNLVEKFGVTIVVNPEYMTRNNNGSLWLVLDRLANTYICSSDDYFTTNPFESHVYKAYYSAEYVEGPTNEWCITTGGGGRITGAKVGGADAWTMLGHVYFDRTFSSRFREILRAVYQLPETSGKLWESIYLDHVKELDMVIRKYPAGVIYEFDSVDELRSFDPKFMENVDSEVFDTISKVLNCPKDDITDFYPLKQGITNLSCHFRVGEEEYVYRHPGVGTSKIVDRLAETEALELAREIGVDKTFLASDPKEGWKISRFIPQCRNLDVTKDEELETAMRMNRELHESGRVLARSFDFVEEGLRYESLLKEFGPIEVPGYEELRNKVLRLKAFADADGFELGPSHNDFFPLNFLVSAEGRIDLIDWEYAGMSDIAADFGTMVVCTDEMDEERADTALKFYFGRTPTELEKRHFWSYVVFAGWCWYVWALLKEAEGDNIGEVLYVYYRHAADYVSNLLAQYEGAAKKEGVNA